MRHRLPVAAAVVVALLALAGCGELATPLSERTAPSSAAADEPTVTASEVPPSDGPEDDAVLFDGEFVVEESVWSLGSVEHGWGVAPLDAVLTTDRYRRSVSVSGPALYGRYSLTIERHAAPPEIPGWCEDVAEVSLRHETQELALFGFEDQSESMRVPPGDLRVRYCAEGLDRALAETEEGEFVGDDYRLYSARNLLQVWAAPMAPDETLRVGSRFARGLD